MLRYLAALLLVGSALSIPTAIVPAGDDLVGAGAVNLTEIVRAYMNFGADPEDPQGYNCTAWARLWEADGVRNTPGIPPTKGWAGLEATCERVRSEFSLLFCDKELEIDNMSYNSEKRTAFRWTINGVVKSTGQQVSVSAITTLFMRKDGSIQYAWDFLNPTGLPEALPPSLFGDVEAMGLAAATPNITEIVRVYMNFGGFPNYPAAANCSQWAGLFDPLEGIRNTPGVPPTKGFDNLFNLCKEVRGQFQTMLNYADIVIPVISWNAQRRVAFTWGIEGLTTDGRIIQKQAISALFMYQNGTIQFAWDFLDPSGI